VVVDLCLPAALLRLLPTLHFRIELGALVLVPWLLALVAYGVARLAARAWQLDRATETVLFLCTALGNTSFLGFPLCSALLGEESLSLAGVYDQLGSFLMLSLLAPIAIARARGGERPSLRQMLHGVLSFPPFVALLVGLLPIPRPDFLDAVLAQLAAPLVPLAIFAVGLRLRITPPTETRVFALGLAVKLVLMPLLALALAALLDAEQAVREVVVLESAMPAMITAGALAMAAGLAPELAAALIGWGVIASLITTSAWTALLR
jgi:malate permease and related proteins